MAKPEDIGWAPASEAAIEEPSNGKKTTGFLPEEEPPSQWFNWFWKLVSNWTKHLELSSFDIIVGASAYATHTTLAAALADAAYTTNKRVLLLDSATLASTITLNKAGWRIYAAPGVTYTAGAATKAFSVTAARCEIRSLRLSGFTTGIEFTSAGDYGRVADCYFASCTTEIDESTATAGRLPNYYGNITE